MSIPERLGKYRITDVLGKGAMGVVYRAFDPDIRRPVAIKTIRRELIEEDERADALAGRFRREAQAAGALNHPGIVSIYEYGEDERYAYIAMEYVEGSTLREYLARGSAFDERDTVSVMAQLLDALEYAHSRMVWHRDIKPANIIVMSNGRIKLADFGIARIESADRTLTNVIMGTPGYIAPEQYLGKKVDHRVDIYSAGVLFYVLLARQAPFRGRPEAIMHDVCYQDPPPASTLDPDHRWPKYDPVVARALNRNADLRYANAGEFRAAILAEYAQPVSDSIAESTIISRPARPVAVEPSTPHAAAKTNPMSGSAAPAPSPRSAPTTPTAPSAPSTPSTPLPTGWDPAVLAQLEAELARYVGPVARVLVRRTARSHGEFRSLVRALAKTIERREDREAFLFAVTDQIVAPPGAGGTLIGTLLPQVPQGGAAVTPEEVERATRVLTKYIGPIAKVVTKRAAAAGANRREFFAKVVQSLDSDAQREQFLREVGAG